MDTNQTNSRNWQIVIISAAFLALMTKLYLAFTTLGTNDVLTWQSFLNNIKEFGGIGTYQRPGIFGDPFNHPPFMIHILKVLGFLSDTSPFPFPFWIRLPAITADIGSLWLLSKMKAPPLMLLFFALCPTSILISGFHGNTDPVMIFFVLLSIYFIERVGSVWLAGLAFGMALNIKIVPIILIPAIFFYLGRKRAIGFFGFAFGIGFLGSLPYILLDPILIAHKMLGYGGLYHRWGWSLLLYILFLPGRKLPLIDYDAAILHQFLFAYFKYLLMTVIIFLSWRMNRETSKKPSLVFQCGAIVSLFLTLTPGFGVQYLAWLIPFVITLGAYRTIFYYLSSGAYLIGIYSLWSDGTWYYADSTKHWPANIWVYMLSLLCWLSVVFTFIKYLRKLSTISDTIPRER
jgi:hypothetical protein